MTDLSTLVDELPTESLDLYVMHFEAGEVGGYWSSRHPLADDTDMSIPGWDGTCRRCPRSAMGFEISGRRPDAQCSVLTSAHPADRIELMAMHDTLDTTALYDECLRSLIEREQEVRALQGQTTERATAVVS